MEKRDFEMPGQYKRNLAQLAAFIEDRERFGSIIEGAAGRGHTVEPAVHADALSKLREMDKLIDSLESSLAAEYESYQKKMAAEAEFSQKVAEMHEHTKRIYIHIKHETPHLLESFHNDVLGPLPDDELQQFLDEVAILEATKLNEILNGTA